MECIPTCPIEEPGWVRVRHVPYGSTWHPATDNLAGIDVYGDSQDDSGAWSINFAGAQTGYNQFLFASGDCENWLIAAVSVVIGNNYDNTDRTIESSSKQCASYSAKWYNRVGVAEDPWVSVEDHSLAIANNEMVYGEASTSDNPNSLLFHNGADVYIRFDD